MYWAPETRISLIADAMPRNQFEVLKKYFHLNDNSSMPSRNDPNYDKLYKIRPFYDKMKSNCCRLEPEHKHSVDEMIVPSKARWGIRTYNPKKPNKWGPKVWARCGVSGLTYDFDVYVGAQNYEDENIRNLGSAAAVVAKLCTTLPSDVGHKVFCDNYFTTIALFRHLASQGIFAVGTIRANRTRGGGNKLKSPSTLKAEGRGSFDWFTDLNSGLCLIRWMDNGPVNLISSYIGMELSETPANSADRADTGRYPIGLLWRLIVLKWFSNTIATWGALI